MKRQTLQNSVVIQLRCGGILQIFTEKGPICTS